MYCKVWFLVGQKQLREINAPQFLLKHQDSSIAESEYFLVTPFFLTFPITIANTLKKGEKIGQY
jgi:hypothetical protein